MPRNTLTPLSRLEVSGLAYTLSVSPPLPGEVPMNKYFCEHLPHCRPWVGHLRYEEKADKSWPSCCSYFGGRRTGSSQHTLRRGVMGISSYLDRASPASESQRQLLRTGSTGASFGGEFEASQRAACLGGICDRCFQPGLTCFTRYLKTHYVPGTMSGTRFICCQ